MAATPANDCRLEFGGSETNRKRCLCSTSREPKPLSNQRRKVVETIFEKQYINPATGKGWTPREEVIITKIMFEEKMLAHDTSHELQAPCSRGEAIRRMRRRGLDDLRGGFSTAQVTPAVQPATLAKLVVCGVRFCLNQTTGKHLLPDDARANAEYCDRACRQAAYRNRAAKKVA